MHTRKMTLILALVLALAGPALAQEKPENPADKAFQEGRKQYEEAEGHEAKAAVVESFLKRFPDSRHTGSAVNLIVNHLVDGLGEYERALDVIEGVLARIEDADRRLQVQLGLLDVYSRKKDSRGLARLAAELNESRTLNYTQINDIVEAALEAEAWKLALKYAEANMPYTNLESFNRDHPDLEWTQAAREAAGRRRVARTWAQKGWAQVNLGQVEEGLEAFQKAKTGMTYSFAGAPDVPLFTWWGRTLMESGRHEEALELLAPEAIMGENKAAREAMKEAYLHAHGSEAGFQEFSWKKRLELAPEMVDFALPNYQGKTISYADLKGKVVLMAFWFPT